MLELRSDYIVVDVVFVFSLFPDFVFGEFYYSQVAGRLVNLVDKILPPGVDAVFFLR